MKSTIFNDQVLQKLPEAQYREITNYNLPPAPPMPVTYYKFVEKTAEEMDKEVEWSVYLGTCYNLVLCVNSFFYLLSS